MLTLEQVYLIDEQLFDTVANQSHSEPSDLKEKRLAKFKHKVVKALKKLLQSI